MVNFVDKHCGIIVLILVLIDFCLDLVNDFEEGFKKPIDIMGIVDKKIIK